MNTTTANLAGKCQDCGAKVRATFTTDHHGDAVTGPARRYRVTETDTYGTAWRAVVACECGILVIRRTAKFITIADTFGGETRRVGVHVWQGVEHAFPLGQYANCPAIGADAPL